MTLSLFYSPQVTTATAGDRVLLDASASSHAIRSQRLAVDDAVLIADGAGTLARGIIRVADSQATDVLVESVQHESAPRVHLNLVQALAKGDRDLLAVEMATELGVDSVTPWQAQRSIVRLRPERLAKFRAKWQAKLQAAAQQARRARIPVLHDHVVATDLAQLHNPAAGEYVVVLHEDATGTIQHIIDTLEPSVTMLHLVVGPEGGVSGDELQAVLAAGGDAIKIGANVMRSSTAGPVAVALCNQLLQRW